MSQEVIEEFVYLLVCGHAGLFEGADDAVKMEFAVDICGLLLLVDRLGDRALRGMIRDVFRSVWKGHDGDGSSGVKGRCNKRMKVKLGVEKGNVDGVGLNPDVLVSLTLPKLGSREFKGRHFLGGRFMSK